MKKTVINSFAAAAVLALAVSCGSTPKEESFVQTQDTQSEKTEKTGKTAKKTLKVINTETAKKTEETPASIYLKKTDGITLTSLSFPKETTAGKSFSEPFVFKASDKNGNPVSGLEIAVTYPETKNEGKTAFGLAVLTTTENGTVTFVPAQPQTSFNSKVTAYPQGDVSDAQIAQAAQKKSVSAPFKVKTNLTNAGGTIAIVDFTSDGKPVINNSVSSSNLLMSLMRLGFKRVGNADFTNPILKDDSAAVYKAAKSLLGNNSAWLIYGTVKYASQVEKTDDGKYTLTLEGKLTCLNMKDGSILYETSGTKTVTEDKDWNCLPKARSELQADFARELNYGL